MYGGSAYKVAMVQHFSFTFLPFFAFATQLFSTLVMSSNLCNQAPLFTELRLLQGTVVMIITNTDLYIGGTGYGTASHDVVQIKC